MPTSAELKRADEASPGGAKERLQLYFEAIKNHERRLDGELEFRAREQKHVQSYRLLSVACGALLGFSSLILCGYGLAVGANLLPLAAVLAPVSGIAGVFVWGYRPTARREKRRKDEPDQDARRAGRSLPERTPEGEPKGHPTKPRPR